MIPAMIQASNGLDLTSETMLRTFKRDTVNGGDRLIIPAYQYLGLNYNDSEDGGFSFHLYGWGRKDLPENGFFKDDADGELLYGYLQFAKPYSTFSAKLGRQHIFAGVTNQSVDGLQLQSGVGPYLSFAAFGGLPVTYEEDNGHSGDGIYGGRLAHQYKSYGEIGISFQRIIDNQEDIEKIAGLDLSLSFPNFLFDGLSSFNLESEGWREHRYDARLQWDAFTVNPIFHYFRYQDYFSTGYDRTNLFRFLADTDETLTLYGIDVHYNGFGGLDLGVRGRRYDYSLKQETAYYTGWILAFILENESQIGVEVGQMYGESTDNRYTLYRGYFSWNDPVSFLSPGQLNVDTMYINYDEPIFGRDASVHFSLGGSRMFLDNRIEVKLSGNFDQDPYFDEDIGVLLTILVNL